MSAQRAQLYTLHHHPSCSNAKRYCFFIYQTFIDGGLIGGASLTHEHDFFVCNGSIPAPKEEKALCCVREVMKNSQTKKNECPSKIHVQLNYLYKM